MTLLTFFGVKAVSDDKSCTGIVIHSSRIQYTANSKTETGWAFLSVSKLRTTNHQPQHMFCFPSLVPEFNGISLLRLFLLNIPERCVKSKILTKSTAPFDPMGTSKTSRDSTSTSRLYQNKPNQKTSGRNRIKKQRCNYGSCSCVPQAW